MPNLILSRKVGERVYIGDDIVVTVVEIRGNKIRLGFAAPVEKKILRKELWDENQGGGDEKPGED